MLNNGIASITGIVTIVGYPWDSIGDGVVGDLGCTAVAVYIRYFLPTQTIRRF